MRWVMVEVHVMIAGKPSELSKCRKQIYYRNNPQREEARKCYHTMRPFTGKLVKATKESYSPICFLSVLCKIHPHHPPPNQIVASDNGLTLAFNNSPTEMTGDKSMPLDKLSAPHALETTTLHAALFQRQLSLSFPVLSFPQSFPEKLTFEYVSKILKSKRMKFDLQMSNHHVFWVHFIHSQSIYLLIN